MLDPTTTTTPAPGAAGEENTLRHDGIGVGDLVADRYRILRLLGRGGMGVTWAALDTEHDEEVALKVLGLEAIRDWKALELFEREARVLRGIEHPNVPRYRDYRSLSLEGRDLFVLAQELVEGGSLRDRIGQGWRPDEAEVRRIAREILETLVYLHGRQPPIIHRDIKPNNIVLRDDGLPFLVDFGAVRDRIRREGSVASTVVGTYGYMAPEQYRGQALQATDLYGLGATLVYLLTRCHPDELPQKRLRLDFRGHARVSAAMADWLDGLLEPAPEDRTTTAQQALEGLARVEEGTAGRPSTGALVRRAPQGAGAMVLAEEPPAGSRIVLRDYGDSAELTLPARGLRGMDLKMVYMGGFALFWLGFVMIWTFGALQASALFAMFSIPFWIAGFGMLGKFVNRMSGSQRIEIGPEGLTIHYRLMGMAYRKVHGRARDVLEISCKNAEGWKMKNQSPTSVCHVQIGIHEHRVGAHLSEPEGRWLEEQLQARLVPAPEDQ